jgi:hypothetical protein
MDHPPAIEQHDVVEPRWVGALVEVCESGFQVESPTGELGYRWYPPGTSDKHDPHWTVVVYPLPTEAYGGAVDGASLRVGLSVSITPIFEAFETVSAQFWFEPAFHEGAYDGPELTLFGRFLGHEVRLRLLAQADDLEPPVSQVNVHTGEHWALRTSEQENAHT